MAKYRKLTDRQWENIRKQYLAGEKIPDIAKKYGIHPATIRNRFSNGPEREDPRKLAAMAQQAAAIEKDFQELHPLDKGLVVAQKNDLMTVAKLLNGAAIEGAKMAYKLMLDANQEVQQIDPAKLKEEEARESMTAAMRAVTLANASSKPGLSMLDMAARSKEKEPAEEGRKIILINAPEE